MAEATLQTLFSLTLGRILDWVRGRGEKKTTYTIALDEIRDNRKRLNDNRKAITEELLILDRITQRVFCTLLPLGTSGLEQLKTRGLIAELDQETKDLSMLVYADVERHNSLLTRRDRLISSDTPVLALARASIPIIDKEMLEAIGLLSFEIDKLERLIKKHS